MHTELMRASLTKLEEEIAAFERWQENSHSNTRTRNEERPKPWKTRRRHPGNRVRTRRQKGAIRESALQLRRATGARLLEGPSNLEPQLLRATVGYSLFSSTANRPQPESFVYKEQQHETPSA
jgi:hypothetical protein